MTTPPREEMVRAFLDSDTAYDGVFFTAVKTTGIFCRPACPARKPLPQNVEFFATVREAMFAGVPALQALHAARCPRPSAGVGGGPHRARRAPSRGARPRRGA